MFFKQILIVKIISIHAILASSVPIQDIGTVIYEETPTSQKAVLRDPALLRCVAATRVELCRWTWRPFGSSALMRPLVVREFEAFGAGGRDCSVRFRSLLPDHEGEWTCSVLAPGDSVFHAAPTALIRVVQSDNVQFSERPESTEVQSGEAAVLRCVVQRGAEVEWCRWTWRPLNQTNAPRIPVKEFPPFGNESRDCSVRFRAAQLEQAGEWSCGVRPRNQLNFQSTQPVALTVLRREMKFVQLSHDLQVAAGETVLLRCVTATRVERCRWLWRPFSTHPQPPPAIQVKNFAAFGNESHDCSVRFSSVLPEQAGEWMCGVQPSGEFYFQDAPAARLNLLPAVKVRFVEVAEDTRAARGTSVTLPCAVTARVSVCRWTWKPMETFAEAPPYPVEFPAQGNWSRDCSLTLGDVQRAHQGLWTCSVLGPPGPATLYSAPPAKLTIYHPVEMEFSELTRNIQMPAGSPVLLRCVAAQRVESCRWVWRPVAGDVEHHEEPDAKEATLPEPTVSLREFAAFGNDSRDCSVRFRAVVTEQSGEWTCGVRPVGEVSFQDAPPARLKVIRQAGRNTNAEFVTVSVAHTSGWPDMALLRDVWSSGPGNLGSASRVAAQRTQHGNLVSLSCQLDHPFSSCHWLGPRGLRFQAAVPDDGDSIADPQAAHSRFWALAEPAAGVCSLAVFAWDKADLADATAAVSGRWRCLLTLNISGNEHQVEASTHLAFSNTQGNQNSTPTIVLLLMVLIGLIVMLSILLAIAFNYRRQSRRLEESARKLPEFRHHGVLSKTKSSRHSDSPRTIRFSFPVTEILPRTSRPLELAAPASTDVEEDAKEDPVYARIIERPTTKLQTHTPKSLLMPNICKRIYQNLQ